MPFYVAETINSITDSVIKMPLVHTIVASPIYTALVITAMVMLIYMITFRDVEAEEPILTLCMRGGFWVFSALIGVIFLHNKVLMSELAEKEKTGAYDEAFDDTITLDEAIVPVKAESSE